MLNIINIQLVLCGKVVCNKRKNLYCTQFTLVTLEIKRIWWYNEMCS